MYRPNEGCFAFRIRRDRDGQDVLEGVSHRYTAIVLIGLAHEDPESSERILGGGSPLDVCAHLVSKTEQMANLGDVALTLWAARALGANGTGVALDRLKALRPHDGDHPTVEVAWALTALSLGTESDVTGSDTARQTADRLMASFVPGSGLFRHWPAGARGSRLRGHVACFADLVYPIQALAHYYARTGDARAVTAATGCAERMCALQGEAGQWWWHFDVRTGRVVERYPVYAVHQDAMAPMALFDLQAACGVDHASAVQRGLDWLRHAAEIGGSLVDLSADLVWRKVARHEPGKLSRTLQASASRLHSGLRVPALEGLLRPGRIDYECRPYHLGWLLYAWADGVRRT
jgi:hypothetical protein